MKCGAVSERLSEYLDGELLPDVRARVVAHLSSCPACEGRLQSLQAALGALAELPRYDTEGRIAAAVCNRLEVEQRGPGLALLFRPSSAARPLILPALMPAALVFVTVLAGAFALDRPSKSEALAARLQAQTWEGRLAPSGTEANPLFPSSTVGVPVQTGEAAGWVQDGEGSLFLETVVARDGSVSAVNVLDGDGEAARTLLEALRQERFEPVRVKGRPVAVSVYRLFSRMEVRPPTT